MQPPCRIELFGRLRVRQGDLGIDRFQTQKTGALLAYLALHRPRPVPREVVAELLWPEGSPTALRNRLNQAVSSLRRQLHPPDRAAQAVLVTDHHTLALAAHGVETDVEEFRDALARAERAKGADRAGYLRRAVELYQGELLSGYFDEWILPERLAYADRYGDALDDLVRYHSRIGEPETAIEYAQRRVAIDPADPRGNVELMDLYLRADRPASALRHFDELVNRLEEVPPEARALVARAERQMKTACPSLPRARREPSPPSPAATPSLRPRLPQAGTRFFGRERELDEVAAALEGDARLVTLLGIGGSGKTRLALEVAHRLRVPVVFVSLVNLSDARSLPAEVLRSVGPIPGGTDEEPREALARGLGPDPLVLVLDNLEHLAGDVTTEIGALLDRLPNLSILATSREPVGLREEWQIPLGPLPVPGDCTDLAGLAANPSVALFVARAQAVRPDFQLTERTADAIAALCRQLEGLPLAIELAAGWARVLTPAQIMAQACAQADRLESRRRDIPARHRTMRTAVEGTVDLLDAEARDAFFRFSVFAGDWDREAAMAVAPDSDVDARLDALAARSLIRVEDGRSGCRFSMLDVLRGYGRRQLSPDQADETAWRHANHYLSRAEVVECPAEWAARVGDDYPNYLAALEYLARGDQPDLALRLAAALTPFWEAKGRIVEGRARIEALLGSRAELGPRSAALAASGRLAWLHGDYALAKSRFAEALDGFRRVGDRARELDVRFNLQLEAHRVGNYESVRALLTENLALAQELGDLRAVSRCHLALGNASVEQLRWDDAKEEYGRSLEAARACDDDDRIGQALNNLGNLALLQGQREAARRWIGDALERFRRVGHHWHTAMSLLALAKLDAAEGELTTARTRLHEALDLAGEEDLVVWRVLLQAAFVQVQAEEWDAAAMLFGYVETLTRRVGAGRHGVEMAPYGEHVARLRRAMPEARAAELWEVGRYLSKSEATARF